MYTQKDYRLYVAADNAQNFMILDSINEKHYLIFTWDVTDDEIAQISEKFYDTGLEDGLDFDNDEWTDDFLFNYPGSLNWIQSADEYIKGLPWYAVQMDEDDNDWGTGSHSKSKALRMALEMGAARIAKIEGAECVDVEEVEE